MDDVGKEAMIPEVEQSNNRPSQRGVPKFIKEFSKQHSRQERQQLATEIRIKRKEYFDKKDEVIGKLEKLEDVEDKIVEAVELKAGFESLSSGTQGMLKGFYSEQVEKWSESDYAKEDIQRYFTEEHLSSLNLDEYLTLWRRFPSEVVTHITRQGVRDHFGHESHTAGMAEYHENFVKLLQDGRVRSVFGHMMVTDQKEKAVAKYLKLHGVEDKEDALIHFEQVIDINPVSMFNPGGYPDSMAVHLATEQVADVFYGAESGNEIFFAFPSALIASQYHFKGMVAADREDVESEPKWNDLWVWANEEKGIPINAGLVFIPADAKVDRRTGSKYAIDEAGKAVVNQHCVDQLKGVVASPLYKSLSEEILNGIYNELDGDQLEQMNDDIQEKLKPYKDRLKTNFGIEDETLQNFVLDPFSLSFFLRNAHNQHIIDPELSEKNIIHGLLRAGLYLKESEDTISSKGYWKNFFNAHPNLRPSKVVYYSGGDPSEALYEFRQQNNLTRRRTEDELGFEKGRVTDDSSQDVPFRGKERFRGVVLEVIDKIYPEAA